MAIKDMPLDFRIQLHKELITHAIVPTCLNCAHTDDDAYRVTAPIRPRDFAPVICGKYKVQVPIQVVVVGCADWVQGIPF